MPVRTSAQRRFHTKYTRIVRGEFNDGCALVGRHGRARRRRPYQTPSYFSTQSHTNKIPSMRNSPQTKSTVPYVIHPNVINRPTCNLPKRNRRGGAYVPARTSAQRRFHTQMDEYNYTTHQGRKCIAHSRPHSLKQVVYANWHRDDAHLF